MRRLLLRMVTVDMPPESRPAFRREAPATLVRMVSQGVLLQVAAQLILQLGGSESLAAALFAGPFVGLLLSLAYVELGRNASPLTLLFWPEAISRVALFAAFPVGLLAPAEAQPVLLAALLGVSFASSHLVSPLMGAIYGAIYPPGMRGQIVAFGRMLQGVASIIALWGLGNLFDLDPGLYAYVLPALGLLGLVTTWWFCRLPRTGYLAGSVGMESARKRAVPRGAGRRFAFWHVVRTDRNFVRFQAIQFVQGTANHAAMAVLAVYAYKVLELSIAEAMWVVNSGIITNVLVLFTVRFHGRLFDRIGVLPHRTLTSVFIALGWLMLATSQTFAGACVAAVLMGFGRSGGQIVWLIGSLSFAPRHLQGVYSGIHTFLTGVRGVIAPLVGVALLSTPGSPLYERYDWFFAIIGATVLLSALGNSWIVKIPNAEARDLSGHQSASASASTVAPAAVQADEPADAAASAVPVKPVK